MLLRFEPFAVTLGTASNPRKRAERREESFDKGMVCCECGAIHNGYINAARYILRIGRDAIVPEVTQESPAFGRGERVNVSWDFHKDTLIIKAKKLKRNGCFGDSIFKSF